MSIYIPEKIKIGYQNRNDTYTKKLAYVIYYDEKGKLRKETSWNSWRDEKIEPDDFDNEPTRGFVLNKKVGGDRYGWNPRQTYTRVYDPRGFEFEITIPNLLFILEHCDCLKGKGLDGEFVYGWDGKELVLIPVDSPDYKEIKKHTDKIQNGKRFKGKDLIIGATYLTKNEEKWVYMGRFDKWEKLTNCFRKGWRWSLNDKDGKWEFDLDDTWTLMPNDKNTAYKHVNKGKYYWFRSVDNNNYISFQRYCFETRKNIGDILIDCVDEKPSQNYAEYFDDLENNHFNYNPINFTSETLLDLPYDKFIERIKKYKYTSFLNSYYEEIKVIDKGNGTYLCQNKEYLPSELYEKIKPKYNIYQHIDGKEFHNYYNNYLYY